MTAQEFQAELTIRAARTLAHYVLTTDPERRDWTPEVPGAAPLRSALDLVAECIAVNHSTAGILRGDAPPAVSPATSPRTFADADDACQQLIASAETLAAEIRRLSDDDLNREFATRRGPMRGLFVIEGPLRNMHYHSGQINLLQLLHGDAEFRPYKP